MTPPLRALACAAAACALTLFAQTTPVRKPLVAATPPMGWNSWDSFGSSVTEAEVKANADYMAAHLKQHGWQYVVVDIQWAETAPDAHAYRANAELAMDAHGRLIPAPNRFPSSVDGKGFKPLADYIHAKGLKFGIHIMRGIPKRAADANLPIADAPYKTGEAANRASYCPWNSDMWGVDMTKPAGQAYYDSIVKLYASWGVDFIKADDIGRPGLRDEIAALHKAIVKSGRPMVLSLSPGPAMAKDAAFLAENANMWRISDDFWDDWALLRQNFILMGIWSAFGRPGAWPDADMLPLGHMAVRAHNGEARWTKFTRDEQRTMMSLWSIAQSPLIFGGHLPDNDEWTNSLITNDEVLAVNQHGRRGRSVLEGGAERIWIADAPEKGALYLAVFNIGDGPHKLRLQWNAIGMPTRCAVRDLWTHADLGVVENGREFELAPHASGLYKLTAVK